MKNLLNASNYLFILIFSLILFSRMGHDLTPFSIPDASFVLFLVGGFLLRKSHFLALMLLGLLIIDIYALSKLNGNPINIEVTYFIHLFCYLIPWFFASKYLHQPITFSKFFNCFSEGNSPFRIRYATSSNLHFAQRSCAAYPL